MAKKGEARQRITLKCTECGEENFRTEKNKKNKMKIHQLIPHGRSVECVVFSSFVIFTPCVCLSVCEWIRYKNKKIRTIYEFKAVTKK